jgi:hypothetical protein
MLFLSILFLAVQTSDGVHIEYDEIDRSLATEILETVQDALPQISDFIGYVYERDIRIKLVSNVEEFRSLTEAGFPDWGVGFADAKNSLIIICSPRVVKKDIDIRSITRHELAHIVLGGAARGRRLPRWFNEGIAMYCSHEWRFGRERILAIANFTNSLIPLSFIEYTFPSDEKKAEIAYTESFSAVAYIIKNFGEEALRDILKNLTEEDFPGAMFSALGISYGEFAREWETWTKKTYNWAYFLFSNWFLWIIILVVFFIVSIVSVRSRRNKLKELSKSNDWGNYA